MPDEKIKNNGLDITFHGERFDPDSPKNRARLGRTLADICEMERRADMPSPAHMAVRATPIN